MSSSRLSHGLLRLLRDTVFFVIVLTTLHLAIGFAHRYLAFDVPRWWPLSIFNPRTPTLYETLLAAFVALGFAVAVWRLERARYKNAAEVAAWGTLLLLGSNAVQGTVHGFVRPTTGGTIQYYHDAKRHPETPLVFLRDFDRIQPTLGDHGRTHPPGAVLFFQMLIRLTRDHAALISVLIAVTASLLSAGFFRLLLSAALPGVPVNEGVYLLLLLPAIQLYYCATLDAIIASLLLGAVGLFALPPNFWRTAGSALCLTAVSFLTFGFVWAVPLLLIVEANRWIGQRNLLRLSGLFAGLIAFYAALYFAFGFSYIGALRTATRLENSDGFRLLAEPLSYFFTRLEDIAEIALFTGPVLLSINAQSVSQMRREFPLCWRMYGTALATLFLLFLTGAYRTGETARACLFIFPYLLLPVLAGGFWEPKQRRWLLTAVFGQALLMQLLGSYFW